MKKIYLLLLPALLVGCNNDDNAASVAQPTLEGTWKLVNVTGGITGQSHDFIPGTITWTFDDGDETVHVVNNNPMDSNAEDFFETGTYPYHYVVNEVSAGGCNHTLEVHTTDLGCQNISGSTMTLAQVVADGYVLTLRR